MARLSKAQVYRALDLATARLIEAGGPDQRVSRADVAAALPNISADERALVASFFKWLDHHDARTGATLTAKDVQRGLAEAKEKLIAAYDTNRDGLSSAEVKAMSKTGKLAVALAQKLKAQSVSPERGMLAKYTSFYELTQNVQTVKKTKLTSPAQVPASLVGPIITATHQASYTDTKTLADCFAAVDQSEFVVRELKDPSTGEALVTIDFGAGDNTYGAVFTPALKMVASIHDDDISLV